MPASNKDLAIYIHWPFCKSKCPYCDFNSHVSEKIEHEDWRNGYLRELKFYADRLGQKNITSIFFGGGTPSLMQPRTVESIINSISGFWNLSSDAEITLETNPTSFEIEKLRSMKLAGVNRVSIGVQSFDTKNLKFLGRQHSSDEAQYALKNVSEMYDNFSFDLIYALPGQTIDDLKNELEIAYKYARHHISMYQLTIEKGTEFFADHMRGKFTMPEDGLAADMYDLVRDEMGRKDFVDYEVSNYAKPGFESKHNLTYWRYGDYLGIGPGAHGRISSNAGKSATVNIYHPARWLSTVSEKNIGLQSKEPIDGHFYLEEFMLMGLRIKNGISREDFIAHIGKNPEEVLVLDKLLRQKLIECDKQGIRATAEGRLVLNHVIEEILPE